MARRGLRPSFRQSCETAARAIARDRREAGAPYDVVGILLVERVELFDASHCQRQRQTKWDQRGRRHARRVEGGGTQLAPGESGRYGCDR
ncbi:MAG: hypothetical protein ACRD44_13845 [Bryobacteraceae bacterium]